MGFRNIMCRQLGARFKGFGSTHVSPPEPDFRDHDVWQFWGDGCSCKPCKPQTIPYPKPQNPETLILLCLNVLGLRVSLNSVLLGSVAKRTSTLSPAAEFNKQ